jgi:hypothetical protein
MSNSFSERDMAAVLFPAKMLKLLLIKKGKIEQ